MSQKCLERLKPDACAGFSVPQLDSLENAGYLRPACLASLTAPQCAAFANNSHFLSALESVPLYPQCNFVSCFVLVILILSTYLLSVPRGLSKFSSQS
jgi:hypothetical protein